MSHTVTNKKIIQDSKMSRYSLSRSILSFSLEKSKEKLITYQHQDTLHKSIKEPIQKIKQIGEEKYRTAMKHMEKFNKYDQERKQRKMLQNQLIDSQCTFKPKINKTKKYMNLTPRFMVTSYIQRYTKDNNINPENISFGGCKQKDMKEKQNEKIQKRVYKWQRNQDVKRLHRSMQMEERKSLKRSSSLSAYSNKKYSALEKESKCKQSIVKMYRKGITKSYRIDETSQQDDQVGQQSIEEEFNQINEIKNMNLNQKHKNSLFSYNKLTNVNNSKIDLKIDHNKINQSTNSNKKISHPNVRKLYTQQFSSLNVHSPVTQKLQYSQNSIKESNNYSNSYMNKKRQKNQTLVKNNQYSKNYYNQITKIKK